MVSLPIRLPVPTCAALEGSTQLQRHPDGTQLRDGTGEQMCVATALRLPSAPSELCHRAVGFLPAHAPRSGWSHPPWHTPDVSTQRAVEDLVEVIQSILPDHRDIQEHRERCAERTVVIPVPQRDDKEIEEVVQTTSQEHVPSAKDQLVR